MIEWWGYADAFSADPHFSNVSLLLHGDGANSSTTIIDSSPLPKTITVVGNAQIGTVQGRFRGTSIAFDGDGDALSIAGLSDLDHFTMPGVIATCECWLYLNTLPITRFFLFGSYGTGESGWTVDVTPNGNIFMSRNASGVATSGNVGFTFTAGTWQHLAVVSDGITISVYRNGVLISSLNINSNFTNLGAITSVTQDFRIGARRTSNDLPLNGYICDLRITENVARYTANFAPPTAPFPDY